MQDAWVDLPSTSGLQPVGARQQQDAIVALVPALQASAQICLRRARLQAHVRVGKIIAQLVVLAWEVVGLGLAFKSDQTGKLLGLMHVVRNGSHVVEKLAQDIPPTFAFHHVGAKQQIAGHLDGILQQESFPRSWMNVAQPLVRRGFGTVCSLGRRGEPALVNSATMAAEGVEIIGMQLQPAARNHKGTRHP